MKMTITRALAELKLLDSRIKNSINETTFIDGYQKRIDRTLFTKETKEEFSKKAKSDYQSITALIKRRSEIKSKILNSNAGTAIRIASKEYTVAEAIDRKTQVEYEKLLLSKMRLNLNDINNQIESNRVELDSKIETMLAQSLGTDKKTNKDDYDNVSKPFIEANCINKVDPISIDKEIQALNESIETFINEVDFVLSESNAKTKIDIEN